MDDMTSWYHINRAALGAGTIDDDDDEEGGADGKEEEDVAALLVAEEEEEATAAADGDDDIISLASFLPRLEALLDVPTGSLSIKSAQGVQKVGR